MTLSRTSPARKSDRYVEGEAHLHRLVEDSLVAHVAYVRDGQPMIIPTGVAHEPGALLVHGSTGAGWLRSLATGTPVAVSITALDGVVVARSAFESSMRYRSAVVFGRAEPLEGSAKEAALETLTDTLIPGRVPEVRPSTAKELAATLVVRIVIEDVTFKDNHDAWPEDPPEDVETDAWAGVLPRLTTYGAPLPAPDLRTGIAVPASVRALAE